MSFRDRFPLKYLFLIVRRGLAGRFFLYMFLLITLLMGGVLVIVEKNNREVILLEGRKRGISNAHYLSALSTAPLLMYDYVKLEQNVDEVAQESDVLYALILSKDGSVVAHSRRDDLVGKVADDPLSRRAVNASTSLVQTTVDPDTGHDVWDIAYPVHLNNDVKWGTVRIGLSMENLEKAIDLNRRNLVILYLLVVLAAGVSARILAERISVPVRKLGEGALAVSHGQLDQTIHIETGDELEELAGAFNRMTRQLRKNRDKQRKLIIQLSNKNEQLSKEIAAREQLEEELIKTERLRALGEMSGGVAHDFNNILGAILGRAQLLLQRLKDPEIRKGIRVIEQAALDGAETVRRIQEFTRVHVDHSTFSRVDINQVLSDAIEYTRTRWKDEAEAWGNPIDLTFTPGDVPATMGDPAGLREVFTNLIINAVAAMPGGGSITITTSRNNDSIVVRLSDTGTGMSQQVQKRIFEPFFTTKGTSGSGLGLSICYGIITRHKGQIHLQSSKGKGTAFTITLPVQTPDTPDIEQGHEPVGEINAGVLVIDDDEMMRSLLYDILISYGCTVQIAASGREGVDRFHDGNFDVVFTDLGMEDISGWKVAEEIKKLSPDTPVVLISGWGKQLDAAQARNRGVDYIISKPFRIDDLRDLIHKIVISGQLHS
jgi:signal transduction histidine kinase/CheY-like chemotaxis protein